MDTPDAPSASPGPPSMEVWLQRASPEQCEAMRALQLDYRFKEDPFSSWWAHLQTLGFTFVANTGRYTTPPLREHEFGPDSLGGNEILAYLDEFSNPSLSSSLQDLPGDSAHTLTDGASKPWGARIREDLLYLNFRDKILLPDKTLDGSKQQVSKLRARRKRPLDGGSPETEIKSKRRTRSGAEVFIEKPKSTKKKSSGALHSVTFPTTKEYVSAAKSFDNRRSIEIENDLTQSFAEWQYLVSTNHSLLFYGAGSKTALLNKFADSTLQKDGNVLVINGFDPDVTVEAMFMIIVDYWLDGIIPESSMQILSDHQSTSHFGLAPSNIGAHDVVNSAVAISQALAKACNSQDSPVPFYIVLHNIDGVSFRNPQAQEAMAALVSNSTMPNGANALKLVASVDHINSPCLLWDSQTCASFEWMWIHVDTFRPYVDEILDESDKKTKAKPTGEFQNRSATSKSLLTVLSTLAPRNTDVLQELARLQIKEILAANAQPTQKVNKKGRKSSRKQDNLAVWVSYSKLREVCKTKMIATEHQKLQSYIKELSDQSAVEKHQTRQEYRIPYNQDKLIEIIGYERKEL